MVEEFNTEGKHMINTNRKGTTELPKNLFSLVGMRLILGGSFSIDKFICFASSSPTELSPSKPPEDLAISVAISSRLYKILLQSIGQPFKNRVQVT
jgi:hypothetical protein